MVFFPDLAANSRSRVGGDPYGREPIAARASMWTRFRPVLGWDRKKCVIVDLDGCAVAWGVLAETGRPVRLERWSVEAGLTPSSACSSVCMKRCWP